MKKIHKAPIVIAALAALTILLTLLIQGSSSGRESVGLFSWDFETVSSDTDQLRELAVNLGVTELYQEFPAEDSDGKLRPFLDNMHNAGISVYYLTGKSEWALEPSADSLKEQIDQAYAINLYSPKAPLKGLMVDVEPYLTAEWDEDPVKVMETYLSCMIEAHAYANYRNLRLIACIPYWLDNKHSEALDTLISKGCDAVALMNYHRGDETANIENEVKLAAKLGKPVINISEFQRPGTHDLTDLNTYYNDGLDAARQSWQVIRDNLDYDGLYFAYHYYNPLLKILGMDQQ